MKWIKSENYNEWTLKSSVLSLGNFDGLHLGHQKLIEKLVSQAQKLKLPSAVLSFYPHPLEVLKPEIKPSYLFSRQDLAEQLKAKGVDYFVEIPFTKVLSEMSALDFFNHHLIEKFKPQAMVIGYDFGFGHKRQGDVDFLKKQTHEKNIDLEVVSALEWKSQPISSSRIRQALLKGEIEEANQMLGREYYKEGTVIEGNKKGRELGFPTANIQPENINLADGVYCSSVIIQGKTFKSITNVGFKPTFNGQSRFIETHLFNQNKSLYGQTIRVQFKKYIRPEMKFPNLEALKNQISLDIESCNK